MDFSNCSTFEKGDVHISNVYKSEYSDVVCASVFDNLHHWNDLSCGSVLVFCLSSRYTY